MWQPHRVTDRRQDKLEEDKHETDDAGPSAILNEPALRAALLALGVGLVWAALSQRRQQRPTDVW
jgi:hypothetical protein